MQNPSAIRTRPRAASSAARELSWSFMLLVILCTCVVAVGFFVAARQHFTSMDYGIKNSKLREQLQNLETEKRRLMLAREVAQSPLAIRKAAKNAGLRENTEVAATTISSKAVEKTVATLISTSSAEKVAKVNTTPAVVRTTLSVPVQTRPTQPKSTGETRSRIVDGSRKEKTEVASLLKLR